VGICGSDINLFKWNDVAKQIAALPFTPGHEATGVIAALGPGVDAAKFPVSAAPTRARARRNGASRS
jgi:D-arabinose 1-dehydrogenase-like Zn-dependent alcohol dehydrogenase